MRIGIVGVVTIFLSVIIGKIGVELNKTYKREIAEEIIDTLENYKHRHNHYPSSLGKDITDDYFYEYSPDPDLNGYGLYYNMQDMGLQYSSESKEWQDLGWND
jgi:hypothetical protein